MSKEIVLNDYTFLVSETDYKNQFEMSIKNGLKCPKINLKQ